MLLPDELQILVRKIVARKPEFIHDQPGIKTSVCPKFKGPIFQSGGQGTVFVFP